MKKVLFDTNMLVRCKYIFDLEKMLKRNPTIEEFVEESLIENPNDLREYLQQICPDVMKIYKLLKNKSIKVYIERQVFSEFLEKNDVDGSREYLELFELIDNKKQIDNDLLDGLYLKYSKIQPEMVNGYIQKEVKAFAKSSADDAYIMAAASLLGLDVITLNTKDFINNSKPSIINKRNKEFYASLSDERKKLVNPRIEKVMPYTAAEFLKIYENSNEMSD